MRNKCSVLALILPSAEIVKVPEDRKLLPAVRALTRVHKRAAKRSEISYAVIGKIEALPSKLPPDEVSMMARGSVQLEWARIGHAHKDSFIMFATSRQLEFVRNAEILCFDGVRSTRCWRRLRGSLSSAAQSLAATPAHVRTCCCPPGA